MSLVKFFTILVEILFDLLFLKVINNSSTLNKGIHDSDVALFGSDFKTIDFLPFYFNVSSLVLVSIEKIHLTLKRVFDHNSEHEVRQKYSAACLIFSSLRGVRRCGHSKSCFI